jgi:glycosyltransferase involved in cell wall biosynthesis
VHIAIIVPAYNVAPYLADAIASVLGQAHTDWTLIVVDDGSTDETSAVAASFQDARIRLLRQPNTGVSSARNTGVAAVLECNENLGSDNIGKAPAIAADAILFLDGDDWLAPTALAFLASTLDSAPHAVASCGDYARVGLNGAIGPPQTSPPGDLLECLLIQNQFANGGHLLVRRAAVEAAGRFRTDLSYGEDWEYWTRIALLGEFAAVPASKPLLFVRERPGSACLSHATDPAAYRPAMDAIYRNQDIVQRLGKARIASLGARAEAEMAWTVGRELIRHGSRFDGLRWLRRSIHRAPTLKRVVLIGVAWLRFGPFRPYRTGS